MIAFTIGGPASAFGIKPDTANPSAEKHAAPTRSVATNCPSAVPVGTDAS